MAIVVSVTLIVVGVSVAAFILIFRRYFVLLSFKKYFTKLSNAINAIRKSVTVVENGL